MARKIKVKGHRRADGTKVKGHVRVVHKDGTATRARYHKKPSKKRRVVRYKDGTTSRSR